jgi:hypothetical protein
MTHHYHRPPSRKKHSDAVHYGYDEHENYNEDTKDYGGKNADQRSVINRPEAKVRNNTPPKKRHS